MRPPASKEVVAPFSLFDHRIPKSVPRRIPTVSETVQKKEEKAFVKSNNLTALKKKWNKKLVFLALFGLGIVGAVAVIGALHWCDAKWCGFTW